MECRNFTVSLPVLFEIIEALEITCAEFYSDNYVAYKQDKEILDTLNALPAERKNSFLDLIKNTK